jgi:DNA replicative helicase MCM subunit Mcm2 (Cdc46/Mcm family)
MELAKVLLDNPSDFLQNADAILTEITKLPGARLRVKNLGKSIAIREIRAEHVGKFIQVEGIMTRASEVKPEVKEAVFKCLRCGEPNRIMQIDEVFREPLVCENPNCSRRGPFKLEVESSEFRDWQSIRIQERPEELRGGRMPRLLDGIIKDDFVDKAVPGNHIVATGVLRVFQEGVPRQRKTTFRKILFISYIEVMQKGVEETELSPEDENRIKELAKDPWLRNLIIQSIAPSIYGYEAVKEGIALQLFGCSPVELPDGTRIRGDTHILLTGDPGTAKSEILKWVSQVAPRGLYTSGKKATGAGLCVAPGSLVMLGNGAIIEIDKLVNKYMNPALRGIQISDTKHGESVISLDLDNLRSLIKKIKKVWKLPAPEKLVQIETQLGRKLILTQESPLLTMRNGRPCWLKANEFKKGDYIATYRKTLVKPEEPVPLLFWLSRNTAVVNAKNFVKEIVKKLRHKYGSIRRAAKRLGIKEGSLYYNWRNEKARGNPSISSLTKLAQEVGYGLNEIAQYVDVVKQRNGTSIKIPSYHDFVYFTGLIASDGHIGSTKWGGREIRVASSDEEFLSKYSEFVKKAFGVRPELRKEVGKTPEVRFRSKLIADLLEKFGIPCSKKSNIIDIPEHVAALPDDLLASYLRGIFDGDGSVCERNTHGSSTIEYLTVSPIFANKLQLLLLRFGILAKLRHRNRRKKSIIKGREVVSKKAQWSLTISGLNNLLQFYEKIGFTHPSKKLKLEKIIRSISRSNPNLDIIPQAGPVLGQLRKSLGVPPKQIYGRNSHRLETGRMNPTRKFLEKIVTKLAPMAANGAGSEDLNMLKRLAFSDLYWDRIEKVQILTNHGISHVYDFTIDGLHNFMANGIVVHNTATAVRDEIGGGWTLEAGALVITDGGLACIDEFDKMSDEDRSAILESLEQQTISVAKAGIVATLNTRTAVLAAANPKGGRFDKQRLISEQIDLPPVILSRFDLIFIMRDEPLAERDRTIAHHMLELHREATRVVKPPLDTETLRKLIVYARKYIEPKFEDEEVLKTIEDFYVKWRSVAERGESPVPITPRQLEALIRLAKANARMRLSDRVTVEDANRAIKLVSFYLREAGVDTETGKVDIDVLMTGKSRSQREKIQRVLDLIKELESEYGGAAPVEQIKSMAESEGISGTFVERMIEEEMRRGHLYEPKPGMVSRTVK